MDTVELGGQPGVTELRRRFESEDLLPVISWPGADNSRRWQAGERFHHLFEISCDRFDAFDPLHAAVETENSTVTYRELDERANRMAHMLVETGLEPGGRVAIRLERSADLYVAMLAISKAGGAYVPLDPGFPAERILFICEDAGVSHLISCSPADTILHGLACVLIDPNANAAAIAAMPSTRPQPRETADDSLAYVIYTSGTTGKPKGVPIDHSMIVNFLRVACETYGYRETDRVYQGLTIAFDFSIEEILVPLCVGATLVPPAAEHGSLVGQDLSNFLVSRRITALCCVPTVLASFDDELPDLRFILASGEACPKDLVARWWAPDRVFINAYGPTETTVTATLAVLDPDVDVTIGRPLPTYSAVILAEGETRALPFGEIGEISIAGPGLSRGYLNRPEQTARAFIPDFLSIPDNTSGMIYRTGDLGFFNSEGEIEYLGRIDTQVKIRGYRIELSEIESVLMKIPAIAQAAVDKVEPRPGEVMLAAWYSVRDGFEAPLREDVFRQMRMELPSYMVPAFFEKLDRLPMLPSQKVDRKSLPMPTGERLANAANAYVAPEDEIEIAIANVFAEVLGLKRVSIEDDLFDDLGADSLLIAKACATIRRIIPGSSPSMRDAYANRTVRTLSETVSGQVALSEARTSKPLCKHIRGFPDLHVASDFSYYACGLGQLATYLVYSFVWIWALSAGINWAVAAETLAVVYLRLVLFGAVYLTGLLILPIAVKWLLVGRFAVQRIPVWSFGYYRFWLVKTLIRANPVLLFVGTPFYNVYLRLLGAKIGRDVVLMSSLTPVATDLIEIGNGAVINKDVKYSGYRVTRGWIETGPVTIGRNAHIGDESVLDIDTELAEDCDLAHASSLTSGQRTVAGKSYHGTPAVITEGRFRIEASYAPSALRGALFNLVQFANLFFVAAALPILTIVAIYRQETGVMRVSEAGEQTILRHIAEQFGWAGAFVVATTLAGALFALTLPRLYAAFLKPGREYRLYGLHHLAARAVTGATNLKFYNTLFGDSALAPYYLRALGYKLDLSIQTGSNFGNVQKHDSPYLCEIGKGTMISDGLAQSHLLTTNASFKLEPTCIGAHNFFGNAVVMPAGARIGDNVLVGTKTLVPVHGPLRENTGILGSPAFEIPRSVKRDREFDYVKDERILKERLARKLKANLATIGYFLLSRWIATAVVFVFLPIIIELEGQGWIGALEIALIVLPMAVCLFSVSVACEWIGRGFKRHRPQYCSIYDPYYWRHERYWKLTELVLFNALVGTPFRGLVWKAFGVKWGRKVFDDGVLFSERTMVEVGDYCSFNEQTVVQSHSLEEGAFKSDHSVVRCGATLGVNAFVHYGAVVGENAVLDCDAFLMKGETMTAGSFWQGNPAREILR
ncbi:peptide synthetase [Fulvimarina pelagi HTCC2506]|uniref:Peptide synthetase n=1 Tax=Fulvimarina pelagi HTCC2506 TaxID=314231 RepID=Q0G336_9HYPH|nr:Pls/PosA family non-ribosomal peptide synthetase [Fulvimarina pelagi]EAU41995.1 peptide synthetase [Fulvimarina pelagi HTCC2506]